MENKIFAINKTKTFTEWLKHVNSDRCGGVTTCLIPKVEKTSKTIGFIYSKQTVKTEKYSENGNCKEGNDCFAKNEYNGIPTYTVREEYKSISNRLKTQDHNSDYIIQSLDYNPIEGTLKIKDKTRIF